MKGMEGRVRFLKGTPYEMGHAMGMALGPKLEANIREYTRRIGLEPAGTAAGAERNQSLDWITELPPRFREELSGLADGAAIPFQVVADWAYLEPSHSPACTALACVLHGRAWIARNNDTHVPSMWGYITVSAA